MQGEVRTPRGEYFALDVGSVDKQIEEGNQILEASGQVMPMKAITMVAGSLVCALHCLDEAEARR